MGFFSRFFGGGGSGSKGPPGGPPSRGPRKPIVVDAISQEYAWLEAHPCACGGRWLPTQQSVAEAEGLPAHIKLDRIDVACADCGRTGTFLFQVDSSSARYQAEQAEMMRELLGDDAEPLADGEAPPGGAKRGPLH